MSSKQLLISLFGLPRDEIIFQDYGCAVKTRLTKYGRIFLSENHYSFYANIAGSKTIICLHIDKVDKLEKKGKHDIDVYLKEGKVYHFTSFGDRESAFQLMNALHSGTPIQGLNIQSESPVGVEETSANTERLTDAEVEVNFITPSGQDADQAVELMKVTLPVSVDTFFDFFLADEASLYSIVNHRQFLQDSDIQLTKWQEDQGTFSRELKTVIKLKDVPFKDKSRLHKIQTYKRTNTNITLNSTTNTLDVPYANYFQCEERWEVNEFEGDAHKCVLRCYGWVVFVKSTMMKKTIQQRSLQGLQEDYGLWIDCVKKKLEASVAKPSTSISDASKIAHEFEDSNVPLRQQSSSQLSPDLIKKETQIEKIQKLLKHSPVQGGSAALQVVIIVLLLYVILKLHSIESRLSGNQSNLGDL